MQTTSTSIRGLLLTVVLLRSLAECIYKRRWLPRPSSIAGKSSRPTSEIAGPQGGMPAALGETARTTDDDAKLIFGTVFSLRNMVRKLGGEDDR